MSVGSAVLMQSKAAEADQQAGSHGRHAANRVSIPSLPAAPKSKDPKTRKTRTPYGTGSLNAFSRRAPGPHSLGGTWGGTTTPMRLDAGAPRSS